MKIRELLNDASKWTKRTSARTASGRLTQIDASDAVCWCLLGALAKCYSDIFERDMIRDRICYALAKRGMISVGTWNDNDARTFEEVKQLIEELDI